ncbi:leucine-rich repeat-containing protein 24-like [Pecten maximus]|uniref:leucine-rich repeat-containing protein 24-like n=1 Tax=Pecten maximus TaxID=6579 RepID=UPI001458D93D|nr:leucine-rich repeat-containing protein 24-like [Pecten maximus]
MDALLHFMIYLILMNFTSGTYECPNMCRCHYNVTVSCDAGLQTIPTDISELTKSLHLAGNVTLHNSFQRVQSTDLPNLADLRHFTFSFNDIEVIDNYTFRRFKELRQLKLNHNNIKQIGPATFTGLAKLEVLDLSGNSGIKILDGTFRELPALQELYLGEINLLEIDLHVFDCLNVLKVLDIHGNSIKNLGTEHMSLFPALKVLDISSNSLTALDEKVWESMSKLQTVYIGLNSWQCNCQVKNLKNSPALRNITDALICAGPSRLQYMPLSHVLDSSLKCQPPKIIDCDKISSKLTTGDGFQITCNISGDPFPYVEWKTPSGDLLYPYNSTLGSFSVFENGSLHVFPISSADSGSWTLKVSNPEGIVERDFKVDIQVNAPMTIPSTPTKTATGSRHWMNTLSPTIQTTGRKRGTSAPTTNSHTTSRNPTAPLFSTQHIASARTAPTQIPFTIKQTNYKTPEHPRTADFNHQTSQGSSESGWGYTGIIVASVVGGCSLIVITTLLILLFKCASAKKKVGTTFTENTRSTRHRRQAFV